ncbi:MAG: hypothetical protein ACOYLS_07240 [Polymorphobacter sp.]
MKMLLTGIAAALMATAATAQTPPADPMAPAAPTTTEAPAAPPAAEAQAAPDAPMLTEKDGKWWNGDRLASKSEVTAYKKSLRAGKPG